MLAIRGQPRRVCNGLTRRDVLRAAGAGLFGTSLSTLLAAEEAGAVTQPRAKSVLFLFLFGGPSQLETFDMKPDAPSTIRGPYKPITSRTPELLICEKLPKLAAPAMLAATIFHALGISPDTRVRDSFGRPVPVMEGGRPLVELFA